MQKRASSFVTRNYNRETGSMAGILEELKWETLQKRRKDNDDSTVSSILSGLETRSHGLNTLGTT